MKKNSMLVGFFILIVLTIGLTFRMSNKANELEGSDVAKFTLRSENGPTSLAIPVSYLWIMSGVNEEMLGGGERNRIFLQIPAEDIKKAFSSISSATVRDVGDSDQRLDLHGARKRGLKGRVERFINHEAQTLHLKEVASEKTGYRKYVQEDQQASNSITIAYVSEDSIIYCGAACSIRTIYNERIWYRYTFPLTFLDKVDMVKKSAEIFIEQFMGN